jgi:hypothetical protein
LRARKRHDFGNKNRTPKIMRLLYAFGLVIGLIACSPVSHLTDPVPQALKSQPYPALGPTDDFTPATDAITQLSQSQSALADRASRLQARAGAIETGMDSESRLKLQRSTIQN